MLYKGPIVEKPASGALGALAGLGKGLTELAKYQQAIELEQKKLDMEIAQKMKLKEAGLLSKKANGKWTVKPIKTKDGMGNEILQGYLRYNDATGEVERLDANGNIIEAGSGEPPPADNGDTGDTEAGSKARDFAASVADRIAGKSKGESDGGFWGTAAGGVLQDVLGGLNEFSSKSREAGKNLYTPPEDYEPEDPRKQSPKSWLNRVY